MAFHVAGDRVGPALGAGALGQDAGQAAFVVAQQGVVDGLLERMQQARFRVVASSPLKR